MMSIHTNRPKTFHSNREEIRNGNAEIQVECLHNLEQCSQEAEAYQTVQAGQAVQTVQAGQTDCNHHPRCWYLQVEDYVG